MRKKFQGIITAIVTPFKNDKIDFNSLEKLVHFQVENGVEGFVISGTTGESPNLLSEERHALFKFIKKKVPSEFDLILGTGSNSTKDTVEATSLAEEWGADGALLVVPYYNKPPQRGLVAHFSAVAEGTSLPLLLYNVPGRTITSLSVESVVELSHVPNIVGIKEASGDLKVAKEILQKCKNFILLSGDDATYAELMALGGHGTISVLSHILPRQMREVSDDILNGRLNAKEKIKPFLDLTNLLFCEANPIPVKAALKEMHLIETDELRLPLVSLESGLRAKLVFEMKKMGVLK